MRFWGVNTCFSANFPDKPEAEKLADRLRDLPTVITLYAQPILELQTKPGPGALVDPRARTTTAAM